MPPQETYPVARARSRNQVGRRRWFALPVMTLAVLLGLSALGASPVAAAIVPSEFIIVDIGGAHDWTNPNRTDLSQMGYVGNGDSTSVVFSIDDTDPSGGESVQGCSLYDSNGNGDVDYALCIILNGDGSVTGPTLYSCTDGFDDKCKTLQRSPIPAAVRQI